jgi:hypothetical protein
VQPPPAQLKLQRAFSVHLKRQPPPSQLALQVASPLHSTLQRPPLHSELQLALPVHVRLQSPLGHCASQVEAPRQVWAQLALVHCCRHVEVPWHAVLQLEPGSQCCLHSAEPSQRKSHWLPWQPASQWVPLKQRLLQFLASVGPPQPRAQLRPSVHTPLPRISTGDGPLPAEP